MKLFTLLCLTSFALASPHYYILRRGLHSTELRASLRSGVRSARPPRFVVKANSNSDTGDGDSKKPKSGPDRKAKPKPSAGVSAWGPAHIYNLDEDAYESSRKVEPGEIALRTSPHPKRPSAGGILGGAPSGDEPLKVNSRGKYASVSVVPPPGGSGKITIKSDQGTKESVVKGGEAQAGVAHKLDGTAEAHGSVSRPGEAHAIGFRSPEDINVEVKSEKRYRPEKG